MRVLVTFIYALKELKKAYALISPRHRHRTPSSGASRHLLPQAGEGKLWAMPSASPSFPARGKDVGKRKWRWIAPPPLFFKRELSIESQNLKRIPASAE